MTPPKQTTNTYIKENLDRARNILALVDSEAASIEHFFGPVSGLAGGYNFTIHFLIPTAITILPVSIIGTCEPTITTFEALGDTVRATSTNALIIKTAAMATRIGVFAANSGISALEKTLLPITTPSDPIKTISAYVVTSNHDYLLNTKKTIDHLPQHLTYSELISYAIGKTLQTIPALESIASNALKSSEVFSTSQSVASKVKLVHRIVNTTNTALNTAHIVLNTANTALQAAKHTAVTTLNAIKNPIATILLLHATNALLDKSILKHDPTMIAKPKPITTTYKQLHQNTAKHYKRPLHKKTFHNSKR